MRPEDIKLNLSYFSSTGKFGSGTSSSKTFGSDGAQKRSRRMYLDPYFAARRSYRIGSKENSLGVSVNAVGPGGAKDDPTSREDDQSLLEMGHISVERRWEVNSEQQG